MTETTQNELISEFSIPSKHKTNKSNATLWLLSHFMRYWPLGVMLMLGAFGNAYLAAVVPKAIGQAYEAITAEAQGVYLLKTIAWTILISQVVRGVLQFGRNFGAEWIAQLLERNIREELYISLLGKSMTYHNLQPVGDTMARATNDVREINFMLNPGINLVIGSGFFMVMPLVSAPEYHVSLIATPLLFIVAYIISIRAYLRELNPVTSEVRSSFGKMNTRLSEAIDGIETVKGMSQERKEVGLFEKNAGRFRDAFVKQSNIEARFLPLLLLGLAMALGLAHALALYNQGLISAGDVVAYFGLIQLFGFPTFISLFAFSQVSLGMASSRRILEMINAETDLDENLVGTAAKMQGEIEFKDLCYRYAENAPVLEKINFKVEPGKTVAIVGQTGSGKTSLVKLVNRTYDATGGSVLVDGIDVRDWKLESLRRQISIIEQDIFLFSRSIAENISFGNPSATREDVIEASKAAQAHEFILEFKDGYDTVIGERGVTLSGGQRQRLALARAFLTDPRILVLDDSTSAIDSATEDKIQKAIFAAAKGRTTLIITHRLSQIRWADLIVVLKQGRISDIGTHDELIESSESYRRIFSE
jgi:ATP-binding cassette subfamily B protein